MTQEQLLENYIANLDKALGLVDNTDDIDLDNNIIRQKHYVYRRIEDLMDLIQKDL